LLLELLEVVGREVVDEALRLVLEEELY